LSKASKDRMRISIWVLSQPSPARLNRDVIWKARGIEQVVVRVTRRVRKKIQARLRHLSQSRWSRRNIAVRRKGQLQLKRYSWMQLAPQPQQGFRHPVAEPARAMQPDVATNAQRDQQRLRVTRAAMMNNQPPAHPTYPTFEPVTLNNQLAQAAEPSQRMVTALIAKTATAENLQLHRPAAARAEQIQLNGPRTPQHLPR
jgi:hypothetical protein